MSSCCGIDNMIDDGYKKNAKCLNCRYFLCGACEQRCPECGLRFDWQDNTTYYLENRDHTRWWWFQGLFPPSVYVAVLMFMIIATLFVGSQPYWITGSYLGNLIIGVSIAIVVDILAGVIVNARRRFRLKWEHWRTVCILCILQVIMVSSPVPLLIRFWLSKASLERAVSQYHTTGSQLPGLIGLPESLAASGD